MHRLTGIKDADREILKHVDDRHLLKVCSIDRRMWNEVCDDAFLRRRLTSKYPGIDKYKREDESWKKFFLRAIYYISLMQEKYKYETGDFKKQYLLLKEYQQDLHRLLVRSAEAGELDLVKYALENGANIHAWNDQSLRFASFYGHLHVVKYLMEKGANIHGANDQAVQLASKHGHLEVVKYLIEQGADIHTNEELALREASRNGHINIVQLLVEKQGADIHAMEDLSLSWASEKGHLEVVKYLVERGADIHIFEDQPLRLASQERHYEVVKYLQSKE